MFRRHSSSSQDAAPPSRVSSGAAVVWSSVDPRNGANVAYDAATSTILEQAYRANPTSNFQLVLPYGTFTVKFAEMRQYNAQGGSRKVIRFDPDAPVGTGLRPPQPATPLTAELIDRAMAAVATMDAFCEYCEKNENNAAFRATPLRQPLSDADVESLLTVYSHILYDFASPAFMAKYGFNEDEINGLFAHREGEAVPSYFANVRDQSIFYRKLLSILGLRNLVRGGVVIFSEMLTKLFSGNPQSYTSGTGAWDRMRILTGNSVDLDTVVLRCHEQGTLNTINAHLKQVHGPLAKQFRSGAELRDSDEGVAIAHAQAQSCIEAFIQRFALTAAEVRSRNIDLPAAPPAKDSIPVATGNSDRGRYPMWIYANMHVLSFHANVPSMPDIYGAILRAPCHFVKAYLLARKSGNEALMTSFFEDALADSCFNMKWKAIEEFLGARAREGSIPQVLAEFHATKGDIFTPEFYREDDKKGTMELHMMQVMVEQAKLQGVDLHTRQRRLITKEDVKLWHQAYMQAAM